MLNKKSTIPLYAQIKRVIETRIDAGEYPVGTKIHSENELCKQFDVGRPTIRQALTELSHEGKIESQKGKGVFVLGDKKPLDLFSKLGTTAAFKKLNQPVQTKVLSQRLIQNPTLRYFTLDKPNQEKILALQRLRVVDTTPVIWEETYITYNLVPGLIDMNLENTSLTEILANKYDLHFCHVRQNISITQLTAEQLVAFHLQSPESMLYIERAIELNDMSGHYFSKLVVDTKKYPLYQEITNNSF